MRAEQYGLSLTVKIGPPVKNEKLRGPSKSNHKANSCEWKDQSFPLRGLNSWL